MDSHRRAEPIDPAFGHGAEPSVASDLGDWRQDLTRLDGAVYSAIAATPTPTLDRGFRELSRAADHWKLWVACAAILAVGGGARGRTAAVNGLVSMIVSSAAVNLVLKPIGSRHRPDRAGLFVPLDRHVEMPRSPSFPSGHAAAASAFATGVAIAFPEAGIPVGMTAALVAYSRVHTGVHYPSDVIVGAVTGATVAHLVVATLDRRRTRRANV